MHITASNLYDYLQCPHRVWRDIYGPRDEKIKETNPFVQLLWDKGVQYEKKVIDQIGDFLDLSKGNLEERFAKTITAMKSKTPLIYQGVLMVDNLAGIPDLLRLMPDGSYLPIDIKSGMGVQGVDEENEEEGKLKKSYAVQLALYCDALIRLGFENKKTALIFDIAGNEVEYNLENPIGKINKMTFWELYEDALAKVSALIENKTQNKPAMAGICKLCPWYASCKKWTEKTDDPTCLFYLGRSKRDTLSQDAGINTVQDLLTANVDDLMKQRKGDKNFLKGIAEKTMETIITRANILRKIKKPIVYGKIDFPQVDYELFFDIEDDPTQEFVYLHGVYERSPNGERFLDFTAKEISATAEKQAWADFWRYTQSLPENNFAVYYYSHHEKTTYKRMQKKYSDVISADEVESFFDNPNVIDLYQIVLKNTDWPVGSYSLKALAQYLGFSWRDKTPSGALSIQWFNDYIKTKDERILNRILLYNEDDCRATMVLRDGIENISKK
ncbi:MAG: TM0106 family RecB-like putative nuclease [Candidatus Magasanikbacteria bacterium]